MRDRSADLAAADALAHMDPAPPAIAARLAGLNAAVNQNLLHPDLSPFAGAAEARVIAWLTPAFGMAAGHMTAGSSVSNLAALWAAREHGCRRAVASEEAHVSVAKAARILAMPLEPVRADALGRLDRDALPDLADAALVLTAGTTGRGAIDPLEDFGARWTHVDAAWAGPLRLTAHAARLDGIGGAQSVAVSGHKWLFQPKDSGLLLFRDPALQAALADDAAYLARPGVGIQGSRSAAGVVLLGTLLALGRRGIAGRIERCVAIADELAARLADDPRAVLPHPPEAGVVAWRPAAGDADAVAGALGRAASRTAFAGRSWVRHAVANPAADVDAVWRRIDAALDPGRRP